MSIKSRRQSKNRSLGAYLRSPAFYPFQKKILIDMVLKPAEIIIATDPARGLHMQKIGRAMRIKS